LDSVRFTPEIRSVREQRRERFTVTSFFNEIALAGSLHAEYRQQQFVIDR
jgi:hypothetical protein